MNGSVTVMLGPTRTGSGLHFIYLCRLTVKRVCQNRPPEPMISLCWTAERHRFCFHLQNPPSSQGPPAHEPARSPSPETRASCVWIRETICRSSSRRATWDGTGPRRRNWVGSRRPHAHAGPFHLLTVVPDQVQLL